eukprot:CAMPEP_0113498224 /NCGR_PEP_ID=MMETSP0014_2-20120614/31046_1 /TAXON_ID=2857 /ORGANISM="Nitzschia sp." /LENGTH=466 /DNA_ID=CAMNT_0000392209 /DNA_START=14 /DNA_END=1414 /DNA_ORIENTATION=+ /assembly_acc=CAM_ASM_000159
MTMIKAVRCHRFAAIEEEQKQTDTENNNNNNNQKKKPVFTARKPQSLRLRDCLSLDTIEFPTTLHGNDKDDDDDDDDYVVIRTMYAGIQYPDALQARGLYQVRPTLPYIPGMDVVGRVVRYVEGKKKTKTKKKDSTTTSPHPLQPGTYVYATLMDDGGTGGLAEYVKVSTNQVFQLPSELLTQSSSSSSSPDLLSGCANIGRNFFAAYHSIVTIPNSGIGSNSNPNTTSSNKIVLVTGASGGVGMAAIELAKALGMDVIAGVSSDSKMDGPRSVGADFVFKYGTTTKKEDRSKFKSQVKNACRQLRTRRRRGTPNVAASANDDDGVDLVVDMVQGDLFEQALVSVVRPLGTICLVGFAAGQRPIRPGILLVKEINVVGSLWGRWAYQNPQHHRRNVYHILGLFASGKIRPRVDTVVSLQNFVQAFEIFETNRGRGNTVVSFVDDDDDNNSDNGKKYKDEQYGWSRL